MRPQIIIENLEGKHNKNLDSTINRLEKSKSYQDLSTICIVPTRGMIPAKVVQSWMGMMIPMNQKFIRIFMIGMEVGEAYNAAIELILNNTDLQNWKYILTMEEDNIPPPDGLLKLYEGMEKYNVVGGLYWTKGEGGQPMIYGNPQIFPKNFIPQVPIPDTLVEANGLGMGFNLFQIDIFKKMADSYKGKWFKTLQEDKTGIGVKCYSQDLYFYENASRYGYRFACDTKVKVGHYDYNADIIW